MRGGSRKGAGRKPIQIDLSDLERLCTIHCTYEEIAAYYGCSVRTVETCAKRPEYAEAMARGRAKGRIAVRRAQMRLLEAGNATMGIWLGKQLLGQRDVTPIELTGADKQGPLTVNIRFLPIDDPNNL